MDATVTTVSLAIAVLIGLVSSFVPAWNASRVSVVESIRYSG